jgi:cyclophilin family peptidyl-prolyl cis-trans isomerase
MPKHFFFLLLAALLSLQSFSQPRVDLTEKSPDRFRVLFHTTQGDWVMEVYRSWSPLGADRIYQLVKSGYYNNNLLFRVEPGFVVQFGISPDYATNRFWDPKKLPDEPMQTLNKKGTVAFARGKARDRATQLFINLADNTKLDTVMRDGVKGYTPVAKIIAGMDIIGKLNGRYKKQPAFVQDSLYKYGNGWFEARFPGLDRILSATLIR